MKKYFLINSLVILFLLLLSYFSVWQFRDALLEFQYDYKNENPPVYSKADIDKIFDQFPTIHYSKLDNTYLNYTKSDIPKYKKLLVNSQHYIISKQDFNKKIVAHYRIKDFMNKDAYYKDCIFNRTSSVYTILNKSLLHKTLELIQALDKAGYYGEAFEIVNGHRHPHYNEIVGGASLSRHIKGEAVDISIGDINGDGSISKEDKDIVLNILENKIIKDQGGLGLYPGTQSVHYDVRGYRARWNSY